MNNETVIPGSFYSARQEGFPFLVVRQEGESVLAYYIEVGNDFVGMNFFHIKEFYPLTQADKEAIELEYPYLKDWDLSNLPDWAKAC